MLKNRLMDLLGATGDSYLKFFFYNLPLYCLVVGCVLIPLLKCPFPLIFLQDSMNFGILKIQGIATKNGTSEESSLYILIPK